MLGMKIAFITVSVVLSILNIFEEHQFESLNNDISIKKYRSVFLWSNSCLSFSWLIIECEISEKKNFFQ